MLINSVIIENFRGYKERQIIPFSDLTAFVGKNDVGKSTILEALDIFFNKGNGPISLDVNDINVEAKRHAESLGLGVDIIIGVEFKDLPESIILDEKNSTTLDSEYLINDKGYLTILKRYNNAGKEKVFIYAKHPSEEECCNLLSLKQSELRKLSMDLDCDHNVNADMRSAIREKHKDDLNLQMQELDVTKEDAKNIWEKIKEYMPVYSLFQSDRSNGDKDKEVQDPLREAVKVIMSTDAIKSKCMEIYDAVMTELDNVSGRTLEKIKEMNPKLASTLHPAMPSSDSLKWCDLFKNVSITGDNDIPINKRGSGVKRLVLLNFFRAEAERAQDNKNAPGIIYAIEEPETAQHVDHQNMLIDSLLKLSKVPNTQVILTTHSSNILKHLSVNDIRLIKETDVGKQVQQEISFLLPYPSLNEIAFTYFGEVTSEYHDELYGHIDIKGWLGEYKNGKKQFDYNQQGRDGLVFPKKLIKTEIIRHQIHHPENKHNEHFTEDDLVESINAMKAFIQLKNS